MARTAELLARLNPTTCRFDMGNGGIPELTNIDIAGALGMIRERMRRAARRDGNHSAIVQAFRDVGCRVQDLAAIGCGCPDLLIGVPRVRRMHFVEVKDGAKPPSARALTPDQLRWHREWSGFPVHIVESVDEALALVRAINTTAPETTNPAEAGLEGLDRLAGVGDD